WHAKVVSTKANDFRADGQNYREESLLTGDESRVAEVHDMEFPRLLDPVDDLPPATVITRVVSAPGGKVIVRGVASDNGVITKVVANGREAKALSPNFAEWECVLEGVTHGRLKIDTHAEDAAGNVEKQPHVITWTP